MLKGYKNVKVIKCYIKFVNVVKMLKGCKKML